VGSETGDSQILKILESPEAIENMDTNEIEIFSTPASYLKQIEKISNIGPIQDMIVTSEENCNSQCQLLTCSGDVNSGTLRILRSGIGIQEKAFLPIPGVQSIWAFNHPDVKVSYASDMEEGDISVKNNHEGLHNSVLLTIENNTKAFAISGELVEEISFPGLVCDKASLAFYQLEADVFLQICPHHINLFSNVGTYDLLSFSDEETCINFTEYLDSKIFTAAGKTLNLYRILDKKVQAVDDIIFENDIASLKGSKDLSMIAVGLWNHEIQIFDLEGKLIKIIKTDCASIPQSLMFEKFEDVWYLLASMSDGMLISSRINGKEFSEIDKSILGTGPMTLTSCQAIDEKQNVVDFLFAYGDNPVTISVSNGKLRLTSVNIKSIAYCCCFDTNHYQSSVCICTPDGVLIGSIDSEQKIHIRTRDLKESPNKITYYSGVEFKNKEKIRNLDNSCFVVSCYHYSHPEFRKSKIESENTFKAERFKLEDSSQGYQEVVDNGADNEQYSVLFLDEQTFNVKHRYELVENEMVTALEVMELSDKNGENFKEYIIVATALYNVDETEPLLGRIHVLEYKNNKINVITIKIAEGAVHTIKKLQNNKLVAGVNSTVIVYNFISNELQIDCRHHNNILVLTVDVDADGYIFVGDIFRSTALLQYKASDSSLKEIARDYDPKQVTAVKSIQAKDQQIAIACEQDMNIYLSYRKSAATDQDSKIQLFTGGCAHLSSYVNKIVSGSLAMNSSNEDSDILSTDSQNSFLLGCRNGAVISLLRITEKTYKILLQIQELIRDTLTVIETPEDVLEDKSLGLELHTVGGINHSKWREFSVHGAKNEIGFLDGDLIEKILDFSSPQLEKLFQGQIILDENNVPISIEKMIKLVEDVHRLH